MPPENPDAIDFTALKKARDEALEGVIQALCKEKGWDRNALLIHVSPGGCYCACATGGLCEHNFTGWRNFDDGNGGEQVCSLCGIGAMSHSMRTGP